MEPLTTHHDVFNSRHEPRVHDWRVLQLMRLGVPGAMAESYADRVDWHQVARLMRRGCPPELALRIAY
jgi:hypothetical protein